MTKHPRSLLATLLGAAALLATACSTPKEVLGFNGWVPAVSGLSADCGKPYPMSEDCSGLTGATRLIEIEGVRLKVAGGQNGTVLMIMDSKTMTSTFPNVVAGTPKLVKWLEGQGVKLVMTTAMVLPTGDNPIAGYYLVFDGDAYSKVKTLSVKE